ncbi:MAG: hypothetical protein ACTTKB_04510 [Treponema sp.]
MGDFAGDVLLIETPDGGDIVLEDGRVKPCKDFSTAVYLSLFGGNKDDAGTVKNRRTWWANTLRETPEGEKMISRFQAIITGLPLSVKNIRKAETAAVLDLEWLKNEGAADEIIVEGKTRGKNIFVLKIEIKNSGKNLYEKEFSLLWENGIHGV